MIRFDAWWMPDGETHLPEWMTTAQQRRDGRLGYQLRKYAAALNRCAARRVAVDIGAHIGLFSYWMAQDFSVLHAFEPRPEHLECWRKNVPARAGVELYPVALGETHGLVGLYTGPSSSGDTQVRLKATDPSVPMAPLDDWGFEQVDFIKCDVEGFELPVMRGAAATIARNRPVILIEQKGFDRTHFGGTVDEALAFLKSLGMQALCPPMAGDWVLGWEGA